MGVVLFIFAHLRHDFCTVFSNEAATRARYSVEALRHGKHSFDGPNGAFTLSASAAITTSFKAEPGHQVLVHPLYCFIMPFNYFFIQFAPARVHPAQIGYRGTAQGRNPCTETQPKEDSAAGPTNIQQQRRPTQVATAKTTRLIQRLSILHRAVLLSARAVLPSATLHRAVLSARCPV